MLPSRSRLKFLVYAYAGVEMVVRYALKRPECRQAWITFDDGPHPLHTVRILDTLQRYDVRAAFFWIGKQAERHLDIVTRATSEGHLIGNHSYSHPFLTRLAPAGIREEIIRADDVLKPFMNGHKLFRPPHGDHDEIVDQVTAELGYDTVLWNLSTRDWNRPFQPQGWVQLGTFLARMLGPAIVLMHADLPGTAEHLGEFLDRLRLLGVQIMPPETLLPSWRTGQFV